MNDPSAVVELYSCVEYISLGDRQQRYRRAITITTCMSLGK